MPAVNLILALAATTATIPDGARLEPAQACYLMTVTREGKTAAMGRTWQSIERVSDAGTPAWRVVVHQVGEGGRFDMKDEFVLDAATLRPRHFRNESEGRLHVRLDYRDDRVTGEKLDAEGKSQAVDMALPTPTWEGNLWGVLFAALPLAEGGEYRLPYYQYDKGLGEFTVRVKGKETVATPDGPVEAWVLDAGADELRRSDYLVARTGAHELGYRAGGFAQSLGGDCSDIAARDAATPADSAD